MCQSEKRLSKRALDLRNGLPVVFEKVPWYVSSSRVGADRRDGIVKLGVGVDVLGVQRFHQETLKAEPREIRSYLNASPSGKGLLVQDPCGFAGGQSSTYKQSLIQIGKRNTFLFQLLPVFINKSLLQMVLVDVETLARWQPSRWGIFRLKRTAKRSNRLDS